MWFGTFIVKNVLRRPLRSLLTVTAIAIAIACVVALVGVAGGFERSFVQLYQNLGIDMIVVRAGGRQRLNSSLQEALGEQIKTVRGASLLWPYATLTTAEPITAHAIDALITSTSSPAATLFVPDAGFVRELLALAA